MKNLKMYEPADKMITLIKDNYSVLQALGSFGINLGFGDKTVQETCDYNGVDTYTFLAVVNFTINDFTNFEDDEQISVPTLLHYLEASHAYYLDFQLPFIRRELEESLGKDDHLGHLIMRLYDEYAQEIRRHMKYEEKTLFPYVQSLLDGKPMSDYNIETFSKHHEQTDKKLREVKLMIIKYLPSDAHLNNKLTATLYDIYNNEEWLKQHAEVEDQCRNPQRTRARCHHCRCSGYAEQRNRRPLVHLYQYRYHPPTQHCPQAADTLRSRPHHLRHRQRLGRHLQRQSVSAL